MKIFFSSLFIIFLATALKAAPCDSPDFNACKIDDEERVIVIDNQENVKITNSSNMKIGSIIFTANNFNLTMKDSALDAYRFAPSNYNYKINISMDNSQLTLRNASSVSMEAVNLSNKSTLTVQGLSLLSIDDFTSTGGSEVKIKSSFGMLSLKKATLEDVYMTAGFLRIQGDVVAENIYKVDPTDPVDTTRDYTDLTAGGNIEIVNKGSLTAKKLQASQVHVISGNLTINDAYEIGALDNKTSDDTSKNDEKIVNINADGIITTINLDMLKLSGKATIQNSGSITHLNIGGNESGTLEYLGLKIPDKDGNIDEEADTPTLTLKNTYLDTLILQDGNIKISNGDSTINTITNTSKNGSVVIEYVKNMKSTDVQLNKLELRSTTYNVSGNFNVNNLTMGSSSTLHLNGANPVVFDTLALSAASKITSNTVLDITVNKNLNIFNTLLSVDNLTMGKDSTLTVGIDKNLVKAPTYGVSATGNINLNNTKVVANLQDTSLFNIGRNHSYSVLHADGGINWTGIGETNLPSWFSSNFINNGQDLVVDITRTKTYEQLLNSSIYAGDESTINIAKALDNMVDNGKFSDDLKKVITNIDLRSDINTIGGNIASLRPVSNNVYISDIHTTATIYLDMLSQNSSHAYLKTKDAEDPVLWIRNGFKIGNSRAESLYSGNKQTTYFLMGGFDILGLKLNESYFQLGVAGGFNVNDIKANDHLYDISSSGFNAALYANYIANRFSLSLSSMYLANVYDTTRNPLDSQVNSSRNVSEVVSNASVAYKATFNDNIFLQPSIFYTNGYIMAGNTSESGYAGFNIPSYTAMVHDSGAGILLYTDFKDTNILQGSYSPYVDLKTFYRVYDVPNSNINFLNTTYDINIIGGTKNSMVIRPSVGIDYEKNSNVLGFKYTYENSFHNYSNHQFHLNYKLLLN